MTMRCASVLLAVLAASSLPAVADVPSALARGEAPVLFTAAEGESAGGTVLLDGQAVRGDEIWLYVPSINGGGQVDLGTTGGFFKIWDSGPELGPDGNDDDRNGMRGMDFNPNGKFMISYEDTTTTGFAFGSIKDGDLMEMTPTSVSSGFITGHSFTRLFNEGANGVAGNIGTGDIVAISTLSDGTLLVGMGGSQTINTDVPGTLSVGSSTLAHLDTTGASPVNIGPDKFFEASLSGVPIIFAPAIYTGALRGADLLESGELTFGTSGNYNNTVFSGPIDGLSDAAAAALALNVSQIGDKADIFAVPDLGDGSKNTYQQRTADVLYDGSLFFQTPAVGDAELLDNDILAGDEIAALINLLGAGSGARRRVDPICPRAGYFGNAGGRLFVRAETPALSSLRPLL